MALTRPATLQAVVFDFDGLILDTESPELEAWQYVYGRHGLTLPYEKWRENAGYAEPFAPFAPERDLAAHGIDPAPARRAMRRRFLAALRRLEPMAGVTALLRETAAAGIPLGVASGSQRGWVRGHLKRLGLDGCFAAVRCADDVHAIKPDPAVYSAVVAALGARPEMSVALEDSNAGVTSARAAGLACLAVPNAMTAGQDLSAATRIVPSLAGIRLRDLAALLERRAA